MTNKMEIYYYCLHKNTPQDFIANLFFNQSQKITKDEFTKYYVKVFETNVPLSQNLNDEKSKNRYLQSLFEIFNSEENPLAFEKYQKIIRENNSHTSMSVGDMIKLNDILYRVSGFGFTEVLFE